MPDPIRVAIFGNGFARKVILPCLRHVEGVFLAGISSPNLDRVRDTARLFGVERASVDHREILSATQPDLVFIATPPHRHAEMAIDALRSGCHVVCEKPTALSAAQSAEMLDASRTSGERLALIDHELRFHPGRMKLKEMIAGGRLGDINHVKYTYLAEGRRDPGHPWDWKSDAEKGGGLLGAIGSHAVDCLRALLGEVATVRGSLATVVEERFDPVTKQMRSVTSDDLASATLRFHSGTLATILISGIESERTHRVSLFGTKGAATLDEQGPLLIGSDPESLEECELEWPVADCSALEIPNTDWARSFLVLARRVVEAIRQGVAEVDGAATFEDGHRTQLTLDAIRLSSSKNAWIEVPDS